MSLRIKCKNIQIEGVYIPTDEGKIKLLNLTQITNLYGIICARQAFLKDVKKYINVDNELLVVDYIQSVFCKWLEIIKKKTDEDREYQIKKHILNSEKFRKANKIYKQTGCCNCPYEYGMFCLICGDDI